MSGRPVLPLALLAALVAVWVALAATMPVVNGRRLTFDVRCASGNPVVGVWVESTSGGSWWAERGERGTNEAVRFTFEQDFSRGYTLAVGCGGTSEEWGASVKATLRDSTYRRLLCDDEHLVDLSGECRDEAPP